MKTFDTLLDKKQFFKELTKRDYTVKEFRNGIKEALNEASKPLEEKTAHEIYKDGVIDDISKLTKEEKTDKPTPEPEECKPHNCYSDLELKKTWCVCCGKDFSKPKSKVPDEMNLLGLSTKESLVVIEQFYNELVSYLKEKEDNERN